MTNHELIKPIDPIISGDITITPTKSFYIGGPCAVETEEQTFAIAEHVAHEGGDALRGGAFKPRTHPESFQGLGVPGLDILFKAGREYNLPIVTEVMDKDEIPLINTAADGHPYIFQIGSRNAQNYRLLTAVGKTGIPVLLKSGLGTTVKEILGSATYVTTGGSPVIITDRGITTHRNDKKNGPRYTADFVSIMQFQEAGYISFIDPSHSAGLTKYVSSLALAGIAAGANGLIVEVGYCDGALCDADQAINFNQFSELICKARAIEKILSTHG